MNDDKTAPTCGTLAPNGFDSERLDDILGRADCPDNYDGDEAQEWIIDQRILPDLKYLADAYRAIARPAEVATRSGITESLMVYTKRFGNKTIPIDRQALPRSEPIAVDDPIWPACGACWHVHLAGNRCGSWGCTCAVGGYLPESVTTYEARSGITPSGDPIHAAWVAYWTKATNGQCETNHTAHAAFLAGAAASAPTNEPAVALVQEWRYRTACASESAITKAGDDLAAFIESLGPRNAKRPPSR